jgi:hypothetical protein
MPKDNQLYNALAAKQAEESMRKAFKQNPAPPASPSPKPAPSSTPTLWDIMRTKIANPGLGDADIKLKKMK